MDPQDGHEPRTPPVAAGWPLLGNLPALARKGLAHTDALQQTHGDLLLMKAGPQQAVLVHRPEHAQHVLVAKADIYRKDGTFWSAIRSLIGLGLPTVEGETWRERRRMMNPQFRRARIDALARAMVETIDAKLQTWPADGPSLAHHAVSEVTMAVIVRTMFGSGLSKDDADDVSAKLAFSLDHMMQKMVTDALPAWLPLPGRTAHRDAVAGLNAVVERVVQSRRESPSEEPDLLTMLLEMRDHEGSGRGLTDEELRDETMSLFVAGYETTAVAVSWTLARLAMDPELAARLVDEVDTVLGDRLPEPDDLGRLDFTRRVFLETLRLDAPVFFLPRVAMEDDVIDGFAIPAGTVVSLMIGRIHRHPDHWDDPETFDPDRFLPERSAGRHRCAWLPFGAGRRKCIGEHFAMLEGVFLLAMLARRFRFELVDGTPPTPQMAVTRRPADGMPLIVLPRERPTPTDGAAV